LPEATLMLLERYFDRAELHRHGTLISLQLQTPHRVLSTGRVNGGFTEGLSLVFNHQCCEPVGHWVAGLERLDREPAAYQAELLAGHGLDPDGAEATGMATAASVRNLGVSRRHFRDTAVVALATAGVDGNAARVGEPASVYEHQGRFELLAERPAPPAAGTINLLLLFNQPLEPGALVRAAMMATEAKCAVLQELSIPSRRSAGLATGTGTDQMVLAAPLAGPLSASLSSDPPLTSAGHHCVLGELIGQAAQEALRAALGWQNHLTPVRQCSSARLLERFGLERGQLMARVAAALPPALAALVQANGEVIERDPPTVAAVAALLHVHDQITWGVIPALAWRELALSQAAQVAVAAAGRAEDWPAYHQALAQQLAQGGADDPVTLVVQALALGFADKWPASGGEKGGKRRLYRDGLGA